MEDVQIVRKIHLYGKLKDFCGGLDYVEMVGDNLRIITAGLVSRFGVEVKQFIVQNNWHVFLGKTDLGKTNNNRDVGEEEVDFSLGHIYDVHILPVIEGAGKTARIIAGVVLIVVGAVLTYFGMGNIGVPLIKMGIGMVLTALLMPAATKTQEKPDERASFIFNGPVNTMGQGGPVSLIYGRFLAGSSVVSAGINAEQLQTYTSPTNSNPAPNNVFIP